VHYRGVAPIGYYIEDAPDAPDVTATTASALNLVHGGRLRTPATITDKACALGGTAVDYYTLRLLPGSQSNTGSWQAARSHVLDTCFGLPLRLVAAILCSVLSFIDLYIERDAPLSWLGLVSPFLAESATPAAICWALDFAGIF
jgi:hypothetical protein